MENISDSEEKTISAVGKKRGSYNMLDSRSKKLVSSLRDYLAKERDVLAPLVVPSNTIMRTATALNIDLETVRAIVQGEFEGYEPPKESDNEEDEDRTEEKVGMPDTDCFKLEAIRQVVHSFLGRSELVTRGRLVRALRKADLMPVHKMLGVVLYHLGFYWKNCLPGAKVILERDDFASKRCKFLRTMTSVNLKNVIWVGETCLYLTCVNKTPYTRRSGAISKGGRVLVLHAGSYAGWVQGAEQVWTSRKINSYLDDIGSKGFLEWMEKLLNIIPENSVIVMEDNLCHSEQLDKPPKQHNTRDEIIEWLGRHNVWVDEESSDLHKAELLGLVAETRSFYPTYLVDDVATKYGHTVIRLPPCHSHFNPIEKMFLRVQSQVERRAEAAGGLGLADLEAQTQQAISSINQKCWSTAVTQAGQLITKCWAHEPKLQQAVQALLSRIQNLKKSGPTYINLDGEIVNQTANDWADTNDNAKRLKLSDRNSNGQTRTLVHSAIQPDAANIVQQITQLAGPGVMPSVVHLTAGPTLRRTPITGILQRVVLPSSLNPTPPQVIRSATAPNIVQLTPSTTLIQRQVAQPIKMHFVHQPDGVWLEPVEERPMEVVSEIIDMPATDDMGLFPFTVEEEEEELEDL